MISNILVPIDFSDNSIYASKVAAELAKKSKAKIHLLHVITDSNSNPSKNEVESNFKSLMSHEFFEGINIEFIIRFNHVYAQIIQYEKENEIDFIVIGSIKESSSINSLSIKLKQFANSPVLIVRSEFYKKENNLLHVQNEIIEHSNFMIKTKQKEITDSLYYAKRIQSAILPSEHSTKKYLKNHFILYKPKDIVAGDFYWLEHIGNTVLFAAADCTGHGVPGAMVSVVCKNALNHAVRDHGITDPGLILDTTRKIITQEFEESDNEMALEVVKDGMDIALCSLEGHTLKYAGANNALWLIRNGALIETKANRQPIGKFDFPLPFTTHTFNLQKDDTIYIFSDGYVDQFGGAKEKKFKTSKFKELLLSVQHEEMDKQQEIINSSFEAWKGNLEQVDDVCIIGVRI